MTIQVMTITLDMLIMSIVLNVTTELNKYLLNKFCSVLEFNATQFKEHDIISLVSVKENINHGFIKPRHIK